MLNTKKRTVVAVTVIVASALSNPLAAHAVLAMRHLNGWSTAGGQIDFSTATKVFEGQDSNPIDYWDGDRFFLWQPVSGIAHNFGVEWNGSIRIDQAGQYGFGTISDDGSEVWIDDTRIVANHELQWYDWEDNISEGNTPGETFPPLILGAGYHSITVRFTRRTALPASSSGGSSQTPAHQISLTMEQISTELPRRTIRTPIGNSCRPTFYSRRHRRCPATTTGTARSTPRISSCGATTSVVAPRSPTMTRRVLDPTTTPAGGPASAKAPAAARALPSAKPLSAAVPEPTTSILMILAAVGWCLRRRATAA